jgi:hypothetical protein
MFGTRVEQLSDLDAAFQAFIDTAQGLSPETMLRSLGDWTPRDIVAHFIGWNRITLVGCAELREGVEPFYFYDGTDDYRVVNAGFFRRYPSQDAGALLSEMAATMRALVSYLTTVPDAEWDADTGIVHYRSGPATPARCVDSLIRDYRKHRDEILAGPVE